MTNAEPRRAERKSRLFFSAGKRKAVLSVADKVDSITLEIEATTQKADKGIDKTIESLKAMKTALNGINTKKLRQEMESFEDFQKKLQTVFSNIKVSGNTEELRKQITQAEARLDTLLSKENKLKTVSGIDENSKQYRNLQYDIADVCNTLDQLYAAMDKVNAQKPLNFWEKPNWAENLQNYGTTDESIIKSRLGSVEDVEKVESVATYAANNIKQSFAETAQTETEAAQNVQKLGGKMQTLKGIAEQLKTAFSGIREKISLGSGAEKFNAALKDYWVNYGEDFNRDISVQRYTHNSISGAVQAAIVADNPLTAAFKEIAETVIVPAIQNVETQAKRQADKNEQTIVEIGGRTITNAVREQKSRNGFSFQPT